MTVSKNQKHNNPSSLGFITPIRALWCSLLISAIYPIVGKFAVGQVSPSAILIVGSAITVLCCVPWLTKNNLWGRLFAKDVFFKMAMGGLFGTALPFLILLIALEYTSPANFAILNQVEVLYSLALAAVFLKERPSGMQLLGTALVIGGVGIVLFNGDFSVHWKGDLLVIGSVWMYQVSHIFMKKLPSDLTPFFLALGRAFFAFFWSIPLAVILHFTGLSKFNVEFSGKSAFVLVFMGVIYYLIANGFWYKAIRNMDLSKATAVILSYPAVTYIVSVIVGMDTISPFQISGLVMALIGAYLVTNIIRGK